MQFHPPLQPSARVEWVAKKEAAKLLRRSTRTLLAMAKKGEIQSRKVRDPDTSQTVVQFHAGDIERLRYQREHPTAVAVQSHAVSKPLHTSALPAHLRPWLTLDEAEERSGLTRRWLLARAKSGAEGIRDMGGPAKGGRWRFHREALAKP